ncbi:hypothetical protein [Aneurinibacillus tyrosinisolvens]|nr:hypothetical protein [Aneurinibacillus tyrosinisolvens]
MKDVCIYCGEELVFSERSRSYCWMCREMTEEAYGDDVYYDTH